MPLAHRLDALMARLHRPAKLPAGTWPAGTQLLETRAGTLRVLDTGGSAPALIMAPDGPCVIEHHVSVIERLRQRYRVICFDLPGFGFSYPQARYCHELHQGADVLLALMDALRLERATLALSCVNGYYGMAAAKLAPDRVERLVLTQTPGMASMLAWMQRNVPKPIGVPVVGQVLNQVTKRRIAHGWYKVALADRNDRPHFQQIADHALCAGGCFSFAGVVQGMARTSVEDPLLSDIRVPTTLVWGQQDRSHKPTDPESIRRHIPQARVVTVGAGHFADLEAPADYAAILDG